MGKEELFNELQLKKEVSDYAAQVYANESLIPELLTIIETDKGAIKYLCEKIIRFISVDNPWILYPYFDRMALLIDHSDRFIQLGFLLTMPNMLKVDVRHRWFPFNDHYLSYLNTCSIAVFGNVVTSLWKVLKAYPEAEDDVIPLLLRIDKHIYYRKGEPSPECLEIAKEHILDCFDLLFMKSDYKKEMLFFAHENTLSRTKSLKAKSMKFLQKKMLIDQAG